MVQKLPEHTGLDTLCAALRLAALRFWIQDTENYSRYVIEPRRVYLCEMCNSHMSRSPSRPNVYVCTKCHTGWCRSPKHVRGTPELPEFDRITKSAEGVMRCPTCRRMDFLYAAEVHTIEAGVQ